MLEMLEMLESHKEDRAVVRTRLQLLRKSIRREGKDG